MPGVVDVVRLDDAVAVVADTWWRARKARDTLKIEWDNGDAAKVSTASIADGLRQGASSGKELAIQPDVGNVDEAMRGAAKVIKAEYWSQMLAHAPIEPMNFTASFKDGKILLVGPTQFQQGVQGAVSAVLGIKPEDITLKTTFLGGGFGRRLELDFVLQAALVSKAVNRPVKVLWTREDDMTHDWYRPMALNTVECGVDAAGNPVALKFKVCAQSITQRMFGLPKDTLDAFVAEAAVAGYKVPATRHTEVLVDSGTPGRLPARGQPPVQRLRQRRVHGRACGQRGQGSDGLPDGPAGSQLPLCQRTAAGACQIGMGYAGAGRTHPWGGPHGGLRHLSGDGVRGVG
jgi:isoquinoline 1-oxidoreductase beta subunit